ncbi:uncharacterized protein LOC120944922, partial [Rana temporaria]|uniref:uncharacterized protein LOC120944922 n=1 Tax=Rana temporaria TaxID=8407 RepID=UPI001AACCF68
APPTLLLCIPAPNVALRGIPTQSSTMSYYGSARNANDGSLARNYLRGQCSYTKQDEGPWWMVDLKQPHKIMSVAVTNRVLECCRERIFGAEIRIGNDPSKGGTSNPSCGVISSVESGETLSFSCQGMTGQYVTIFIPGRAEHLVMCEVQVFGFPAGSGDTATVPEVFKTPNGAPNVAVKGVAQQSSLYNMYGEAKNSIDGSLDSNYLYIQCSGTSEQDNPWWTVDLKEKFKVFTVAVTNRGDCCPERINGAQIRIGNSAEDGGTSNPICGIIPTMASGETLAFECDGMVGQYVTIFIPGKTRSLTLCEVQVFGLPSDTSDDTPVMPEARSGISDASKWTFDYLWGLIDDDDDDGIEYLDDIFGIKETTEDKESGANKTTEGEGENLAFRGISSQSSTYDKLGAPENAIDGSTNTNYMSKHCSHTDLEIEPWWMVDLTKVHNVTKVKILNRGDCCIERIEGAELRIGTSPERGGTRNPRCAKITSLGLGKEQEYVCGMVGQYVTVTIPGKAGYLTLCEVKVYGTDPPENYEVIPVYRDSSESTEQERAKELKNILKHSSAAPNVAPSGETSQSSTDGGDSSKATDGLLSTCTRTTEERDPWLTLDLKSPHKVFFIALSSKKNSDPESLGGAEIHVGNSATGWKKNPVCGTVSSMGPGATFSFKCDGMEGRYVTVVIPDKDTRLEICEVQVFGLSIDTPSEGWNGDLELQKQHHGVENVAPRGLPSQSSHYSSKDTPGRAIDGSLLGNSMRHQCTHTKLEKNPWWKVDLKSTHRIQSVALTNRDDCCRERINGAEIHIGNSKENGGIGNPRCETVFKMNYGETMAFGCRGMEGRYVSIHLPNQTQYLSLCEVQVFGEPLAQEVVSDPQSTAAPGSQESDKSIATVSEESDKSITSDLTGKYFLFPEESDNSYVDLSPALPLRLNAFSLCMKVSLNVSKDRETILFSYRTLYFDELNLWQEKSGNLGFYMSGEGLMFPTLDRSKEWQHICLTWESKHGRCELWVNGRRYANRVYRRGHQVRSGGIAMLGQDQDALGRDFEKSQSFVGRIKDLNMWDKVLSLKTLRAMFRGKETTKGNVFDWSELAFSKKGNVRVVDSE